MVVDRSPSRNFGAMRTVTKISQLTVAAALGLSLAACGSSSSSGGGTSAGVATGSATSQGGQATSSAGGSSDTSSAGASDTSPSSPSSSSAGSDRAGAPDAKTLVHEARTAYGSAKSAKLHADMTDNGQKEVIDIRGAVDGSNQEVTIATPKEGTATIRTITRTKNFIKGDKTFWTKSSGAPEATASLLADKWVTAPASTAKSLGELSIKAILDSVMGPATVSDSKLETAKTAKSTVDGKDVYVITTTKGNTITISADKKYVLEVNSEKGTSSSKGKMTLSGWDAQPKVEAPPNPVKVPSSAGK